MPMCNRSARALLTALTLVMLLALSGCGTNNFGSQAGAQNTPGVPGNQPDRVQVQTEGVGPNGKNPTITLTLTSLVQRLYATTIALPQMPKNQACTDELGTSYKLVFLRGEKKLATVVAQRFSCQPVTTEGSQQTRRATPAFWALVDQAVYAATPVIEPQWLAIQQTLQAKPPLTARITSAATVQRLYNAILALPLASSNVHCSDGSTSAYSLLFHKADLALPAVISDACNTITLDGQFRARGGEFVMNASFKQLLNQTLAAATFAPAQPDQLALDLQIGKDTTSNRVVTDINLMRQLYTKVFALPPATQPLPAACSSGEDKITGTGKWYSFNFSQWGMAILNFSAHEGSCKYIARGDSAQSVQGDDAFWNLVHQTAGV